MSPTVQWNMAQTLTTGPNADPAPCLASSPDPGLGPGHGLFTACDLDLAYKLTPSGPETAWALRMRGSQYMCCRHTRRAYNVERNLR